MFKHIAKEKGKTAKPSIEFDRLTFLEPKGKQNNRQPIKCFDTCTSTIRIKQPVQACIRNK